MAKFITAKFENREKVMARLLAVVPTAQKEIAAAQWEAATDLANAIYVRAPVKTGKYRSTIDVDLLTNHRKAVNRGVFGKTKDPNAVGIYAWWVWRLIEFGTVKTPAQPHVLPTYRAGKKTIKRKMAVALRRAVKQAKAA